MSLTGESWSLLTEASSKSSQGVEGVFLQLVEQILQQPHLWDQQLDPGSGGGAGGVVNLGRAAGHQGQDRGGQCCLAK